MSFVKDELHRNAEREMSQLGKNCERCGNPVSYKDYADNKGLCLYCKDKLEKMERE